MLEHRPIRVDVLEALEPWRQQDGTDMIALWPHELDALTAVVVAARGLFAPTTEASLTSFAPLLLLKTALALFDFGAMDDEWRSTP